MVNMEVDGVQRRMKQVQALEQLSNVHITYMPMATMTEDRMPMMPQHGGLIKHPLL